LKGEGSEITASFHLSTPLIHSHIARRGTFHFNALADGCEVAMSGASETLIPFAKQTASTADSLDKAGKSILGLLHRAAGMAEENSKHAIEVAQKLSDQVQASERRIRDLEADVKYFQERAERGEQWLSYISSEIEDKFLRAADARGAPAKSSRPANGRN
jgi:hypothetical protein